LKECPHLRASLCSTWIEVLGRHQSADEIPLSLQCDDRSFGKSCIGLLTPKGSGRISRFTEREGGADEASGTLVQTKTSSILAEMLIDCRVQAWRECFLTGILPRLFFDN
jgi:hypothetical protein